ncbi:hypothetical protein JCM3765_004011 [Sporobolomyces pararoseus]
MPYSEGGGGEPIIYASSTVAYTPLSSSPSSVVKSRDGQYAIVTRDEIHLLTPHLPKPVSTNQPYPNKKVKSKGKGKGKAKQQQEPEQEEESSEEQQLSNKKRSRQLDWEFTKTSIKIEKKNNQLKWSEWLDDSEIVTTGQVEIFWKSITFSPSLSSSSSRVLASLNTNCQVLLFQPTKDGEKGEWRESFDLTSKILKELINPNLPKIYQTDPSIRRSLAYSISRAQATSIAWSPPLPSSSSSSSSSIKYSCLDGSILSIGHKSGEISLWRYHESGSATCLKRFRPKTTTTTNSEVNWIHLLKWNSQWKWIEKDLKFKIELAIGDSDGRVWLETITQKLKNQQQEQDEQDGEDEFIVQVEEENGLSNEGGDRRKVSQFCFCNNQYLGFTKLGTLNIVNLSSSSSSKENLQQEIELDLPSSSSSSSSSYQEGVSWNGTSNWSTCSGLIYSSLTNSLQIYLSCGLVYNLDLPSSSSLSTSSSSSMSFPKNLSPSTTHTISCRRLYRELVLNRKGSKLNKLINDSEGTGVGGVGGGGDSKDLDQTDQTPIRRGQSQTANKNKLSKNEGPRILGVIPSSSEGEEGDSSELELMGIIFEKDRPDLFEYHPNSTVKTYFSIFQHHRSDREEETEEQVLKSIEKVIYHHDEKETNALHSPPPHQSLLPILDSLSIFVNSESFVNSLLDILSRPTPSSYITTIQEEEEEVVEHSIEERVIQSLYLDQGLQSLRKKFTTILRLSLLQQQTTNTTTTSLRVRIDEILFSIERELISTVVSKISKILSKTPNLSESEKLYLTRLLLASSALPTFSPPSSSEEGEEQSERQFPSLSSTAEALTTTFELPESSSRRNQNSCPACKSSIPFGNVRTAICLEKNHVWERCSISLELISKVKNSNIKTCSNCTRKVLIQIGEGHHEEEEELKRVNEILKFIKCCAFCGGRWLKVR